MSVQSVRAVRAQSRQRIVSALLDALGRVDPLALTEADVLREGGVSARSFHQHFEDMDDCFDFACEAGLDVLLGPMVAAWSVPRPRPERLGAALAALLGALAAEPRLARLCLLHAAARQSDRRTYRRAVRSFAEVLVDVRRPSAPANGEPSPVGEEALAQGIIGLIVARVADRGGEELMQMTPQLVALLAPSLDLDATDWPNSPPSGG
jgi:AcrR family transcriptional regulator